MSPTTLASRLGRLRGVLEREALDGLVVSQPESRFYLSGYTGKDLPPRDSAGYLLLTPRAAHLLTDFRTRQQAEQEAPAYEVRQYPQGTPAMQEVARLVGLHGVRKLAFESLHLPHKIFADLQKELDPAIELVPAVDLIDE